MGDECSTQQNQGMVQLDRIFVQKQEIQHDVNAVLCEPCTPCVATHRDRNTSSCHRYISYKTANNFFSRTGQDDGTIGETHTYSMNTLLITYAHMQNKQTIIQKELTPQNIHIKTTTLTDWEINIYNNRSIQHNTQIIKHATYKSKFTNITQPKNTACKGGPSRRCRSTTPEGQTGWEGAEAPLFILVSGRRCRCTIRSLVAPLVSKHNVTINLTSTINIHNLHTKSHQ